jgi:pimeloyl-ACP methyl ester carboxylesterase
MIRLRAARRPTRWIAVLAAVLLAAVGCSRTLSAKPGPTLPAVLPTTPVLFVHGYNAATCPGADVTKAQWGVAYLELANAGWRGPLLPLSYYACDHDGFDITGYGPATPAGVAPVISAGTPRVRYDQDTSIDQLAQDLGWYVYKTFGHAGTPVDLVGISMGGLIIRDLLYRVANKDPRFPPTIAVTQVVTFSTPYLGYGTQGGSRFCPVVTLECQQFAVGSPLLSQLNAAASPPQGDGGTTWSAAGSSAGCDVVPASSTLALDDALRVDYVKPCYTHTAYLYDGNTNADASVRITRPDGSTTSSTTALHSLNWLLSTLAGT